MSVEQFPAVRPFRLGSTSYVYPADILPNVERLAPVVDDVELVLFELDDGPSNLPDRSVLNRLAEFAETYALTYTVHLPLDLRLAADGSAQEISLVKAHRVIDCTLPLDPEAYVLHLDGTELRQPLPDAPRWIEQARRSLEIVAGWVGTAERVAVENLERYHPQWLEAALQESPVSLCIDIGHCWVRGEDPLDLLRSHLVRTRVVHLHGLGERDHQSLERMSWDRLDPVLAYLYERRYDGIVTLEVFSERDFFGSLGVIQEWEGAHGFR